MNSQRRCECMSKITENIMNTSASGHMEHYDISNVAPTEPCKISELNIFRIQPFVGQQACKPA